MPFLHSWPLCQIKAKDSGRNPQPGEADYVSNGIFLAGQTGRFL